MRKIPLTSIIAIGFFAIGNWSIAQSNTLYGIAAGTSISSGTWNSFFGRNTGQSTTSGSLNTFIGGQAGRLNSTGSDNTFLGVNTGYNNTIGSWNTFLGRASGQGNISGTFNTFIGGQAGFNNTTGTHNTMIGLNAGYDNSIGIYNTFVGLGSGRYNSTGNSNTSLGTYAGHNNSTGEGNIFLGYRAGFNETSSNKLYIESSNDDIPLIYGDFATDGVGINTKEVAGYTLSVNGKVRATEVKVYTDWADFVFEEDYPLPTLKEIANHIAAKGHLAGIPSADEVEKEGIFLGEMNAKLLQKIEELTLYTIQQENAIEKLQIQVAQLLKDKE